MRINRWLIVGATLIAGVLLAIITSITRTPDPISRTNCQRIESGMTLSEVEAILTRKADSAITIGGAELGKVWIGRDGSVLVAFDDKERVVSRMFTGGERALP